MSGSVSMVSGAPHAVRVSARVQCQAAVPTARGSGVAFVRRSAQRQAGGSAAMQQQHASFKPQQRAHVRRRQGIVAVAAPLAPEASTSAYSVELDAAVDAVRLASRLCQASFASRHAVGQESYDGTPIPANVTPALNRRSATKVQGTHGTFATL